MKGRSNVTTHQGKEVEIERLLVEGNSPTELIRLGHTRSTVYKVRRRMQTDDHHLDSPPISALLRGQEVDDGSVELVRSLHMGPVATIVEYVEDRPRR